MLNNQLRVVRNVSPCFRLSIGGEAARPAPATASAAAPDLAASGAASAAAPWSVARVGERGGQVEGPWRILRNVPGGVFRLLFLLLILLICLDVFKFD
jgi:hypothetical protein